MADQRIRVGDSWGASVRVDVVVEDDAPLQSAPHEVISPLPTLLLSAQSVTVELPPDADLTSPASLGLAEDAGNSPRWSRELFIDPPEYYQDNRFAEFGEHLRGWVAAEGRGAILRQQLPRDHKDWTPIGVPALTAQLRNAQTSAWSMANDLVFIRLGSPPQSLETLRTLIESGSVTSMAWLAGLDDAPFQLFMIVGATIMVARFFVKTEVYKAFDRGLAGRVDRLFADKKDERHEA
jgi:hypothetical protein